MTYYILENICVCFQDNKILLTWTNNRYISNVICNLKNLKQMNLVVKVTKSYNEPPQVTQTEE